MADLHVGTVQTTHRTARDREGRLLSLTQYGITLLDPDGVVGTFFFFDEIEAEAARDILHRVAKSAGWERPASS